MPDKTSQNPNGQDQSPDTSPQTRANRANAQHSTGPRTEEGKRRSSLNALRHGLTGHVIVLPGEDLAAYQRQCQQAFDQFQPANWNEKQLAQTMVDLTWQLHRISAIETNLLSLGTVQHAGITEHAECDSALAMAWTLRQQSQTFANLSIYRQRLSRERE